MPLVGWKDGLTGFATISKKAFLLGCWVAVCTFALVGLAVAEPPTEAAAPFFVLRDRPAEYAGPGREGDLPVGPSEVRIGYFGPTDPQHPWAADMWHAAQLAVDQANARGGYRGKPFRLLPAWSENPWEAGVTKLVHLVYDQQVWAIIGGVDGPSTHLAEQVVAKARLPLVSPTASDKTSNLANVPWIYSLLPGDHLQTPPLAQYVAEQAAGKQLIVLSAAEHDWELFTRELLLRLRQQRVAPRYHFRFRSPLLAAEPRSEHLVAAALEGKPDVLVLVAGPSDSAELLGRLRQSGYAGRVVAGPVAGQNHFLQLAGPAAENVVFPLLWQPAKQHANFVEEFASRFGRQPDYLAAHTYDGVVMLIAAVEQAGLNRARIGDALRNLSPWEGTTGKIAWDLLGANTRSVSLGIIRNGRPVPLAATNDSGCSRSAPE